MHNHQNVHTYLFVIIVQYTKKMINNVHHINYTIQNESIEVPPYITAISIQISSHMYHYKCVSTVNNLQDTILTRNIEIAIPRISLRGWFISSPRSVTYRGHTMSQCLHDLLTYSRLDVFVSFNGSLCSGLRHRSMTGTGTGNWTNLVLASHCAILVLKVLDVNSMWQTRHNIDIVQSARHRIIWCCVVWSYYSVDGRCMYRWILSEHDIFWQPRTHNWFIKPSQ
jgi:hypothetical protein